MHLITISKVQGLGVRWHIREPGPGLLSDEKGHMVVQSDEQPSLRRLKIRSYVTPEQKHSSQAEEILKARSERKRLARLHRLKVNREEVSQIEWKKAA